MPSVLNLMTNDDPIDEERQKYFQSLIGSLLYVSRYTRPDISVSVNILSGYTSNPSEEHVVLAKRILCYLYSTRELSLTMKGGDLSIESHSDADWATDKNDRKSISGYVTKVGNSIVSWGSKKQSCVALSTMEAEYVALVECVKDAIWIKSFLTELNFDILVMKVNCDNSSAIAISKNGRFNSRAKHIDLRMHFIRKLVMDGAIELNYVRTEDNIADVMTKIVGKGKFHNMRDQLNLRMHR
jgi:hypothetical protein